MTTNGQADGWLAAAADVRSRRLHHSKCVKLVWTAFPLRRGGPKLQSADTKQVVRLTLLDLNHGIQRLQHFREAGVAMVLGIEGWI